MVVNKNFSINKVPFKNHMWMWFHDSVCHKLLTNHMHTHTHTWTITTIVCLECLKLRNIANKDFIKRLETSDNCQIKIWNVCMTDLFRDPSTSMSCFKKTQCVNRLNWIEDGCLFPISLSLSPSFSFLLFSTSPQERGIHNIHFCLVSVKE